MTGIIAAVAASGGFRVTVAPPSAFGSGSGSSVITSAVLAGAEPAGSYTYQWVNVGGGSVTARSPTSAATDFIATGLSPGETRDTNYICRVTQGSVSADSEFIPVSVERV